jgi:hypothetical protein
LHIAAFITLCEAYMGIEPHFDLWSYFFWIRSLKNSGEELTASGGGGGHSLGQDGEQCRPLFRPTDAKVDEGVAFPVVLAEER